MRSWPGLRKRLIPRGTREAMAALEKCVEEAEQAQVLLAEQIRAQSVHLNALNQQLSQQNGTGVSSPTTMTGPQAVLLHAVQHDGTTLEVQIPPLGTVGAVRAGWGQNGVARIKQPNRYFITVSDAYVLNPGDEITFDLSPLPSEEEQAEQDATLLQDLQRIQRHLRDR